MRTYDLKEDELTFLNSIEHQLKTAYNSNYIRGIQKERTKQLRWILIDHHFIAGNDYMNVNCSSCCLKLYQLGYKLLKNIKE